MSSFIYSETYRNTDFKKFPEKYLIGLGEQGVLIVEPYKSEILPHWRFKTPEIAKQSAEKIYSLFLNYLQHNDFVGMDMARKFLQMGFTRARRYANHADGKKYHHNRLIPQDIGSEQSLKSQSATIFLSFLEKAKNKPLYRRMYKAHRKLEKNSQLE